MNLISIILSLTPLSNGFELRGEMGLPISKWLIYKTIDFMEGITYLQMDDP